MGAGQLRNRGSPRITSECWSIQERRGQSSVSDRILPIPRIPVGLRQAAQRGRLVIFVGAGVSKLAGCPGWSEFADAALKTLVQQGKFSHGQLAQVSHLNPRVKLSIAQRLHKQHKASINFQSILHPNGKTDEKGRRLYGALSKLGNKFVTTNYDEWLDEPVGIPIKPSADSSNPSLTRLPSTRLLSTGYEDRIAQVALQTR